jgi:hypothetical protein
MATEQSAKHTTHQRSYVTAVQAADDRTLHTALEATERTTVCSSQRTAFFCAKYSTDSATEHTANERANAPAHQQAVRGALRAAVAAAVASAHQRAHGTTNCRPNGPAIRAAVKRTEQPALGCPLQSAFRAALLEAIGATVYSAQYCALCPTDFCPDRRAHHPALRSAVCPTQRCSLQQAHHTAKPTTFRRTVGATELASQRATVTTTVRAALEPTLYTAQ